MAAVSVTAQNTRLDDAETTTDWVSDGGGGGGALETDFFYQGSNCFARKGATSARGIGLSDNANTDLSTATGTYTTVMFKYICTTPGLLDPISTPGQMLEIGSGSTALRAADRYEYHVQGNDTYPIDKSWLVLPIDPNIASHRSNTVGTPSLTVCDWFGLTYDQSAVSKSPNQALDAIDVGAGLTLVGGDGASADGTWQDFSDHDWGPVGNRYGYVRESEGVFLIYGMMVIGSATATEFTDSNQTIIFPEGLFAAGFSGVTVDLQSASTVVDMALTTFIGNGTSTGEDTRPVFIVSGTAGTFDADGLTLTNFEGLDFTSACTIVNSILEAEDITQGGADISDTTIRTTSAANVATIDDATFAASSDLHDVSFVQAGSGHAIQISGASPTVTLTNISFTGYGADATSSSAIWVTATGTTTINWTGGTAPTVRNTGGGTVNVVNSVTVRVTVLDTSGSPIQGARVKLREDPGGTAILNALTNASGIVEDTGYAFTSDQNVEGVVRKATTAPLYKPNVLDGTITAAGYSQTVRLVAD